MCRATNKVRCVDAAFYANRAKMLQYLSGESVFRINQEGHKIAHSGLGKVAFLGRVMFCPDHIIAVIRFGRNLHLSLIHI